MWKCVRQNSDIVIKSFKKLILIVDLAFAFIGIVLRMRETNE